jgi:transcriptional regulator with XRE-family HTH domain
MVQRATSATLPAEDWTPGSIGERIRIIRERRQLQQTELAERMEQLGVPVSKSMVSRFERYGNTADPRRSRRPQLEHMLAMARILEVSPADLGVTVDEYPEIRFLKDARTRALLEATPS